MSRAKTNGLLFAVCMALVVLAGMLIFTGECYAYTGVRGAEVSAPAAGNEFVLLEGDFSYSPKADILKKVNQIRYNACVKGETDPRDHSRKLTVNDYVPVKWSSDLEWMAQTRAAEAALYDEHDRPNGRDLMRNGIGGSEILAWSTYDSADNYIFNCIGIWMTEHSYWLKGDYAWGGHYAALINPANKYCAIAAFVPTGHNFGAGCGLLTTRNGLDESQIGVKGRYLQVIEVKSSMLYVKSDHSVVIDKGARTKAYLKAVSKYQNGVLDEEENEKIEVLLTSASDWKSKSKTIVATDAAGNVTGLRQGKGTLTAKYRGHDYSVTAKVIDRKKSTPKRVKIKSAKGGKGKFTVKWKKVSKNTKGYQLHVVDGNGEDCGYANYKKKTKSKSFYGVPKGTYKIMVRAYNTVYGEKIYGPWSKVKTVKVK